MSTIARPSGLRLPVLRPFRLRARLARMLCDRVVAGLPVRVRYPDGTVLGGGGPHGPTLQVVRPAALFDRLGQHPKIGLGEAYMAGDWRAADGTDLAELLTPFAGRLSSLLPRPLTRLRGLVDRPLPGSQRNTLAGSRANISAHYDLGNDLFARFLDPTMTYSSALFDSAAPFAGQSLEAAQHRKNERILDLADVGAGRRVLEIGTGWGELAIAAARRGARVTSVTLSAEQLELARRRVEQAGVSELVELRLQDYREVRGSFDSVVSVEMVEAVGEEYWPAYFTALERLLAPGGTVALQAILMEHDRLLATRDSFGWVQKYVFPGGLIPSARAIEDALAEHTGLRVAKRMHFGEHYAETLRRWREAFTAEWPAIRAMGFDETFRRTWEFYLAYSEAGFASGYLDVTHLQLTRKGDAT
jgi:cyclopropane-fatty-acyl-phospholipid synthase